MKPRHEVVRSDRRANFFIIENAFIDDWAGVLGPISIAVYCCLWRHADKGDSTFIGTPKLAEKLKLSPRAMQRALKMLADHKLIRIVRTAKPVRRTVFHMLPVPSPAKGPSPMPLFDSVPDLASSPDAQSGANRRRKAGDCTGARVGGLATAQARSGDCTGAALLMEQDPLNKTSSSEQERSDLATLPAKKTKTEPSREAAKLAALLHTEILRNSCDFTITPDQFRKWEYTADRMLRLDGRDPEKAAALIRWAQSDDFWMSNILSMEKFRKQFDQLALKAKPKNGNQQRPPSYVPLPPEYVPASEHMRRLRAEARR
jgi:hypothetical protein